MTFATYIRNAFNDEITIAGVTPSDGAQEMKGRLKEIDVDCGIVSASWVIEMEVAIGTRPPFTVKTVRAFDGNYFGAVIVQRAYTAFVPAVQDFVNDVLTNPAFQAAVRAER